MSTLQHLAQQQPEYDLERFVEVTNDLLPQFLPDQVAGSRGQEPVNPRLVRHYTTQGLLDKPLKQGREARYRYRHLLQLLAIRRLLAEGYSATSIGSLIGGRANTVLEDLLQGGVQLTVEAANPALAFLSQIRDREDSRPQERSTAGRKRASSRGAKAAPPASAPSPMTDLSASASATWTHLDLLDGLELHVREDFVLPATTHERERLLQLIAHRLTDLNSFRRNPP